MKKLLFIVAILFPALTFAQSKKPLPSTFDLLIGTYTTGTSQGIYVYRFYAESGKLAYLNQITTDNPSYLCITDDNKFVYSVDEKDKGNGIVNGFTFNAKSGKMALIDSMGSKGTSPCYVSVDKDQKNIFVANYSSGSLAVFPLDKSGAIGPASQVIQDAGKGVNKDRQEGPHVHTAVLDPKEKYLLYTDLGTDKLNVYRYHASKPEPLTPADPSFTSVTPGNGPRHLTFSADGKHVYLLQEMGAAINVYDYDGGKLKETQTITMLAKGFKGDVGAAAIKISPDGRFLYASNRGTANDIVIYTINPDNGQLTYADRASSLGKGPRDFTIDPTGKYLLVANQGSNSIVVYRINKENGKLYGISARLDIGNPVCLKLVPAE